MLRPCPIYWIIKTGDCMTKRQEDILKIIAIYTLAFALAIWF